MNEDPDRRVMEVLESLPADTIDAVLWRCGLELFNRRGETALLEVLWRREGAKDIKKLRDVLRSRLGKPGRRNMHNACRWAALLALEKIDCWRFQNKKKQCPAEIQDKIVTEVASDVKNWVINLGHKALKKEKIQRLMREPKSRLF
jgi:hypothetical protein